MVCGEPLDIPVTHEVGPAIAQMRKRQNAILRVQPRYHCRAQTFRLGVIPCLIEHYVVDEPDGAHKTFGHRRLDSA